MVKHRKNARKFIFYSQITVDEMGVDEVGADKMGGRQCGNKPNRPTFLI